MTKEEMFEKRYREVFTKDNEVKACGRAECKELIKISIELDNSKKYGDIENGIMNIDNIVELHERITGNKVV